ncbi:chromosomal replication initiation ATPase DnaA [Sphingomonas sp. BE138]|uniref:HdaA/DnaA family protein n=1 Tax=Sphingomonas sp. BE138 TaxID=2817845 RepID=UPI002860EC96|nr:chromosomal replication initiator DnaA [Sphingomonas sp. BE138]MDR6787728.1 chromosomal replication initiation ATPase DnaA [Sphingomonas sp. BE138]
MNQIALPLAWPEDERGEFLVADSNVQAVRLLEHWATWPVRTAILAGPPRSGRSLLGRIFAARSGATVIDDAQAVDETGLFHAWNQAQGDRRPLLLIVAALPPQWSVELPDLRSRLAASPVAQIGPPEDQLISILYERGFARRHLDARADLIAWLTARTERSHAAVIDTIDRLDRAALAGRRRLTIPLARETLESGTTSNRSDRLP